MFFVSVMCCQVEVSTTGQLLVQRSTTDCGVSESNRAALITRRPWPNRGWNIIEKDIPGIYYVFRASNVSAVF
jgi:hypothetical protein